MTLSHFLKERQFLNLKKLTIFILSFFSIPEIVERKNLQLAHCKKKLKDGISFGKTK